MSISGASTSSLRQLTVPSHVSDDEFRSPTRIFALSAGLHVDWVMVDSGAAHRACPFAYANEHEIRETQRKIQFQTASGELLEHHGEKLVPYTAQDSVMGITYQVTDVAGPVAAVLRERRRHDGSVFTTRSMGLRRDTIDLLDASS